MELHNLRLEPPGKRFDVPGGTKALGREIYWKQDLLDSWHYIPFLAQILTTGQGAWQMML